MLKVYKKKKKSKQQQLNFPNMQNVKVPKSGQDSSISCTASFYASSMQILGLPILGKKVLFDVRKLLTPPGYPTLSN